MDDRTEQDQGDIPASEQSRLNHLYDRIAQLHATIHELRETSEELEADRQRLLEENRSLRRKATLTALIDEIETTVDAESEIRAEARVPSRADQFYEKLPSRLSFPLFFQIAGEEQVETEVARRCLVHYLHEGQLVQSGAYLEKA